MRFARILDALDATGLTQVKVPACHEAYGQMRGRCERTVGGFWFSFPFGGDKQGNNSWYRTCDWVAAMQSTRW